MEINKIYNEDCLETLKRMEDNSIDLVVTSPPYNKGWYGDWKADKNSAWSVGGIKYDTYEDAMPPEEYEKWQREIISECMRVLKPSGSLYYNHKDIIFEGLIVHPKWVYDYNVREVILWDRGGSPQISNQFFMPVTEYIWWIVKDPKQVHFDKEKSGYKTNVWRVNAESNPNHPAPFPLKLIRSMIASSCPDNGIVYDPFMGSGTTAVATIQVGGGRKYIGSEISPNYLEYANKRIAIAEAESLTLF
jgi:modification methylase